MSRIMSRTNRRGGPFRHGFLMCMWILPWVLPLLSLVLLGVFRRVTAQGSPVTWYQLRPSGAVPELEQVVQSATTAAGHMKGTVAVVAARRAEGVLTFVAVDSAGTKAGVNALARAINALPVECEPPPIGAGVAVCGRVPTSAAWSGATSNKGDTSHTAKQIADSLTNRGDWIAVVARRQTPRESRSIKSWYSHLEDGPSADNHPSAAKNALVAQLWAASVDRRLASSHLDTLTGALAGFDVRVNGKRPGVGNGRLMLWLLMVAAVTGAWLASSSVLLAVLVGVAVGVWLAAMYLKSSWFGNRRRLVGLRSGVPVPLPQMPVRHPGFRKESRNDDGTVRRFESNEYPFGDDRVPFGAQHLAFFASPHGGAATGANVATVREPSSALSRRNEGCLVGVVDLGYEERDILVANTSPRTIGAIGEAGAGKSELLRSVFAADCARKQAGESRGMVVLESQGAGEVAKWVMVAERFGLADQVTVVDINDPSTPRIDMFAGDGTPHMRARRFLDLFFASDESGADGGVALTPALNALLAVAVVLPHEVAVSAGVRAGSVPWYASVLAGGEAGGDEVSVKLWSAFARFARDAEVAAGVDEGSALTAQVLQRTAVGDSAVRLAPYFVLSESKRRTEFAPVVRRLANLLTIESWFDHERAAVSWADLIAQQRVVILNHGEPARAGVPALDMQWAGRLSEMLLSGVQAGIKSSCSGWGEQNRRVSVFADELSIVAKASPDVPEWMRQQARKLGVDVSFATQAAHQLEDTLLKTLLGFSTMMWLHLGDEPDLLELARRHLQVDRGVWDEVVDSIPSFHAIMLTRVDGERQPAVLVRMVQAAELSAGELRVRCGIGTGSR